MASQICNPETTTHNPTNDANTVNTGSYKARLIASIYPLDKSVYMSKLSQVMQPILSTVTSLVSSAGVVTPTKSPPVWFIIPPGIFKATSWLLILLFLSFPTQSFAQGETYRNRFLDQNYINSVWEDYPNLESFVKHHKQWATPKLIEAYKNWHNKFKSTYKKTTQESIDYLAQQPLGEDIKKLHDINNAYTTWLISFEAYALCVEWQYETKQPFLAFKDFQKTKAKYRRVNCRGEVEVKCPESLNDGNWYDIHECKVFPDWRFEADTSWVGRYATFDKNGIHMTLPD